MLIFVRILLLPLALVLASCATQNATPARDPLVQYRGATVAPPDPTRKISVQDCTKPISMESGNLLCNSDPAVIAMSILNEAYNQFAQQNWNAVIAGTTKVIDMQPGNVTAYATRSGAHANAGNLPQALADSETAIRLDPGFGLAYNNRGYVYELMRRPSQAAPDYEKACGLKVEIGCVNLKRMRQ